MKPVSYGYADVNGIKLYHEVYGMGEPLVLVHGGLTTIREMDGWVESLARTRQVIAVEMQGHGHTEDVDRPLSFTTLGDDIAALLGHLHIPRCDLVGHSFGGACVIRAAIQHPEKVRRLVVISSPYARAGWYLEAQKGMSQVSAAMEQNLLQTPTGRLSTRWTEPHRFSQFLNKMGALLSADYNWAPEISGLPMPLLLMFSDNDSISQKHIADFFGLVGGGMKEPGWLNTQLSRSRLAVIAGYSHYNFLTSTEAPPIIERFLSDSVPEAQTYTSAASAAVAQL